MEGAITNLRSIHVLSVTQYEDEMSHFCLGLYSLRPTKLNGFPSSLRSCCLTSCQVPRKEEIKSAGGESSYFCVVSASVCSVN